MQHPHRGVESDKNMARSQKPRLAVWKFASCDGCQLSILNCERELLDITREVEIAAFLEASARVGKPPYDISLVEGSITTAEDAQRIQEVRRTSRCLVAIGACASAGGIQALRNFGDVWEMASRVYPHAEWLDMLDRSTPVSDHVNVDYVLGGCPVNKRQIVELISALLVGRRPHLPRYSVCMECKRAGRVCVLVAHGTPCMGPVTRAGCGALCPQFARGCYGCFGPKETPNTGSLRRIWERAGVADEDIVRAFASFNAWAEDFRKENRPRED